MKMKKSEITQQCKYLTEEQIQQAIKGRKCIKQWAYICHDKDIDDNGEPKALHWHIMLQFNDTQDSKYIAKWFGTVSYTHLGIRSLANCSKIVRVRAGSKSKT